MAGKTLDAKTIQAAADMVVKDIKHPLEDPLNGSGEYRTAVSKTMVARAIQEALAG